MGLVLIECRVFLFRFVPLAHFIRMLNIYLTLVTGVFPNSFLFASSSFNFVLFLVSVDWMFQSPFNDAQLPLKRTAFNRTTDGVTLFLAVNGKLWSPFIKKTNKNVGDAKPFWCKKGVCVRSHLLTYSVVCDLCTRYTKQVYHICGEK